MDDIDKMLADISDSVFSPVDEELEIDTKKLFPDPKLTEGPEDDDIALV